MIRRLLVGALALATTVASSLSPAHAALAPTYTLSNLSFFGSPNSLRVVTGLITLSTTDTYVTGGFTVTPTNLGAAASIVNLVLGTPSAPYQTAVTISGANAVVKFVAPVQGASNIAATATTATVTVPTGLTLNMPIMCQLDDAATGGGGTGTWAVTAAVSSCKYVSATTFTITSTAAAPALNGNFTYVIPTLSAEIASGQSVASVVIPFIAYVQ